MISSSRFWETVSSIQMVCKEKLSSFQATLIIAFYLRRRHVEVRTVMRAIREPSVLMFPIGFIEA